MKTLLRRFAAALSLASLALSWPLAFVSAQTQTARRILIIGDSQSVNLMSSGGLGQKLSASGITVVGRYTKVCWGVESMLTGVPTVANANCNTGGPVSDFLSQNSGTYDAVVVFLGGNDCASTRPCAANYGSKIDQLIALLQPKSTNIIWFGPTYYESPDKHVQSRTFMNSYMPSRVTHYYDLWDLTTSITKPPGDVHFDRRDPGGYPRFGELVAPIIASFINGTPVAPVTSASTDSGTPPPTADVLGRSPEEVQAQLAAQCADRDPVFPVRLGVGIGGTTEVNGLTEYINVVYRYMTAIVLVVAIVMVTYGGFRYLLAASPIGVKDGKDIIKNAIVGMVLVLSAYVILNTINPATTVLQFTRPPEDIVCHGYQVSIGNFSGGNDQCSEETQERDCGVGKRCVMTKIVLQNVTEAETFGILAAGVAGGAYVGGPLGASIGGVGSIGTMFYQAGDGVHKCTDGNTGSPCAGDEDCNDGTVCAADWQICLPATGNPRSGPCDPARSNMCASGSTCTATTDAWFENWGICRGQAPLLSWEAIRANNFVAPESSRCSDVQDCARTGSEIRCVGPAGTGKKYCIEAGRSVEGTFSDSGVDAGEGNPTPCYIIDGTVNGITPSTCQGTPGSQHACIICGNNNKWQALNLTSDPNMVRIGQCANRAKIGQVCRRR